MIEPFVERRLACEPVVNRDLLLHWTMSRAGSIADRNSDKSEASCLQDPSAARVRLAWCNREPENEKDMGHNVAPLTTASQARQRSKGCHPSGWTIRTANPADRTLYDRFQAERVSTSTLYHYIRSTAEALLGSGKEWKENHIKCDT
jgi:hypothetical protein